MHPGDSEERARAVLSDPSRAHVAQSWRNRGAIAAPTPYPNSRFPAILVLSPIAAPAPFGCRIPDSHGADVANKHTESATSATSAASAASGSLANPPGKHDAPHDAYFRQLFARSEIAASFCKHYLPHRIAQSLRLDPSALIPVPTESIDRQLRARRADLAYRVPRSDGSPLHVFVLLEHKSYLDLLTSFQIATYCMAIWQAEIAAHRRRLSAILPVVVYHGRRPWRAATDLSGLIDAPAAMQALLPHLRYHLVSLSPSDPVPRRGTTSLRVGLEVLQSIFRHGNELEASLVAAIARLAALREPDLITEEVTPILLYANQVHADLTAERLGRLVSAALPDLGGTVMDKTFEKLIEEGMRKGREVGEQRGLLEGIREGERRGHEIGVQEGLQKGIREGERKGREIGVQEGLQKGIREGERKGREIGVQEGLQAGLQEAVILGIEIKFGAQSLDLVPEVRRIHDLNTLRAIRESLPRIQTLTELQALLGGRG